MKSVLFCLVAVAALACANSTRACGVSCGGAVVAFAPAVAYAQPAVQANYGCNANVGYGAAYAPAIVATPVFVATPFVQTFAFASPVCVHHNNVVVVNARRHR